MQFFEWFFEQMQYIYSTLNDCIVFGVPLSMILVGFVLTSIIISVFWKGGRG